ncbi:hypothetical protein K0U83_21585, partial [bacterium]|nr:hypothetical protein [bacterium]
MGTIWGGQSTRVQRFTGNAASQFFAVPNGVSTLWVEGCGGGSGGGGGHTTATGGGGGGGGGGQLMKLRPLAVTPGETLTINVPTGGAGGAAGSNGGSPSGPSGSVLTVTGSVSGLLMSLSA